MTETFNQIIMNIKKITFLIAVVIAISSCVNTKEKLKSEINDKENALFAEKDHSINPNKAREVITLYRYYAEKFPDDTISADYLFKAGDVSSGINAFQNSLEFFHIVSEKYPNSSRAGYALFLQGFINENSLGDTASARKYYEEFIQRYPNHEMKESALFSLQHLGKSAEDIIKDVSVEPDSSKTSSSK